MSPVQQYWLPGYGLSRHIVLGHIHYFLGPSASVRPYSYQVYRATPPTSATGREGYLITGVPLTREQIEDLATMSREYEKQEAARMTSQSHNSNGSGVSSRQSSEPYINELVPIETSPGTSKPRARDQRPLIPSFRACSIVPDLNREPKSEFYHFANPRGFALAIVVRGYTQESRTSRRSNAT
ncbi:hypothetical protein N7504_000534, partial [Penicillium tannophilum]